MSERQYTDEQLDAIIAEATRRRSDAPAKAAAISPEDAALLDRAGELSDMELEGLRKRLAPR